MTSKISGVRQSRIYKTLLGLKGLRVKGLSYMIWVLFEVKINSGTEKSQPNFKFLSFMLEIANKY